MATFLVQRQRRPDSMCSWQNEGDVRETTKAELEAEWASNRCSIVAGANRDGDGLRIYTWLIRDIVLCDDFREMTELYYALRRGGR